VVHNPETGEEWTAVRGNGAWREGRRLTGPRASTVDQTLLGTGFGYDAGQRAAQARVVAALLPDVRDIRRFGSAALDLCFVAEGRLDAYYEQGLNDWDRAAGGLIAEEAGVLVTGLRGEPAGPEMTLAAPPALHAALHDRLVALIAESAPA
jgi:myo-inositol-1(or 4)-monophosphatase